MTHTAPALPEIAPHIAAACLLALQEALGAEAVLQGAAISENYQADWSGLPPQVPLCLLRPKNTAQVQTIMQIAHSHGVPVVPQGGRTGLSGGAMPDRNAIALSLDAMAGVDELDAQAGTLTVWAGTPLQHVQDAAATAGFYFPLDFGARGSCQIGGNIATNAGGTGVLRYGMARDLVLGLEVVLADGTLLPMLNKMIKNNTGYDLRQMFVGSEGTLGVITRAVLRLYPDPGHVHTTLCAFESYDAAVAALHAAQKAMHGCVTAFEVMWQDFFETSLSWMQADSPFDTAYPFYALLDVRGAEDDQVQAFLEAAFEDGILVDAIPAQSKSQAAHFWKIREAPAEFGVHLVPINFDVSVPIGDLGRFVAQCKADLTAKWPQQFSIYFGHIGDSNLHLTVDQRSVNDASYDDVYNVVFSCVQAFKGSISAEHGIGLLKKDYLGMSRSAAELAVMANIKATLDPKGILNPCKILS
jgi:FAD/FMN-containing dehydrogenase